jgi:hypothetical protein
MIAFAPTSPTLRPAAPASEAATLRPGEAAGFDLPRHTALRVHTGLLWLTQEGDAADHLLVAGDTFHTTRPGRVVIQALRTPATLSVHPALTFPH